MHLNQRCLGEILKGLGVARVIEKEEFSRLVRNALGVKELNVNEIPYRIREDYSRFSRKRTVFFRYRKEGYLEEKLDNMDVLGEGLIRTSWMLHNIHMMRSWRARRAKIEAYDKDLLTKVIKRASLFYGADLVGVAPYDERWAYAEFDPPFKVRYVVVLGFEMDIGANRDDIILSAEVGLNYSRMSITALLVSEFIRSLGYNALPQGNEGSLTIPFAVLAGLGEIGRMGLLITPEFGARVRLAKVLTDAPLVPDRPISFGLWDKCMNCNLCADACPAGAIPYGPPSWESRAGQIGVLKWSIDPVRCYEYWRKIGHSCAKCIYACPYSRTLWDMYHIEARQKALRKITGGV